MLGFMTSHEIRVIRRSLVEAGFECHVGFGNRDSVVLNVGWDFGDALRSSLDSIVFIIRRVIAEADISFLSGEEVDGCGSASVLIRA